MNIELDNINRDTRAIDVWGSKTDSWRTVFYQPSLDTLLDQWIDVYRDSYVTASSSPYLFVTADAEQVNEKMPNRLIREAAKAAGIQDLLYQDGGGRDHFRVTAHALRHGHAVHALKSGIDVRTVQEHLGHQNIETTMKYLRLIDDDVRESYRKFGSVEA